MDSEALARGEIADMPTVGTGWEIPAPGRGDSGKGKRVAARPAGDAA